MDINNIDLSGNTMELVEMNIFLEEDPCQNLESNNYKMESRADKIS